jgi:hypothetical protein
MQVDADNFGFHGLCIRLFSLFDSRDGCAPDGYLSGTEFSVPLDSPNRGQVIWVEAGKGIETLRQSKMPPVPVPGCGQGSASDKS